MGKGSGGGAGPAGNQSRKAEAKATPNSSWKLEGVRLNPAKGEFGDRAPLESQLIADNLKPGDKVRFIGEPGVSGHKQGDTLIVQQIEMSGGKVVIHGRNQRGERVAMLATDIKP